jgi:hypothetical protein
MGNFWRTVIRPLLEALERPAIVEIGALYGSVTFKLLELVSERGGVVHVVEPEPRFDVAAASERFGDCFRFHQARSHDVLDEIESADAVLIDGDHNWYTVHGELKQLDVRARRDDRSFPLVMFHDIDWPYARRDQYHDPDSIPGQWRQPWERGGIVWGESQLSATEGINEAGAHALQEGGPRNGVLTAVEDFIDDSDIRFDFQTLPGFHGLGLLASRDMLDAKPNLRRQWEHLSSSEFQAAHASRMASAATEANAKVTELARQLRAARLAGASS